MGVRHSVRAAEDGRLCQAEDGRLGQAEDGRLGRAEDGRLGRAEENQRFAAPAYGCGAQHTVRG